MKELKALGYSFKIYKKGGRVRLTTRNREDLYFAWTMNLLSGESQSVKHLDCWIKYKCILNFYYANSN